MIAAAVTTTAPTAPARLGEAMTAGDALRYLEAMTSWRDRRKAELDQLDQAALEASDSSALTDDLLLSMALWKAAADRLDLLLVTWDSGRVAQNELERLSTLVWGRLDATRQLPGSAPDGAGPASVGALAVSLPEACRLSDALAASLRARLGVDASEADTTSRLRELRAAMERVRDLVDREPAASHDAEGVLLAKLDGRVTDATARAKRGATVEGLLGPLEHDVARGERDLIVAGAKRRARAHDEARARALREELLARGAALRDLATRCVAEVTPAPRFAVPDVTALGAVPHEPSAVDAYLVRLDAVGRAMAMAQAAYAAALGEREELRGRLQGYAAKATALGSADEDLEVLEQRATEVLDTAPADLERARALLAAYQGYLASREQQQQHPGGGS